jgi:hypothetical protein
VFLIGAGSLLVGVALMLAARRWLPAFFTTGTLPPLAAAAGRTPVAPIPVGDRTAAAHVLGGDHTAVPPVPAQVLDPA